MGGTLALETDITLGVFGVKIKNIFEISFKNI